jgi:hypothetical protein
MYVLLSMVQASYMLCISNQGMNNVSTQVGTLIDVQTIYAAHSASQRHLVQVHAKGLVLFTAFPSSTEKVTFDVEQDTIITSAVYMDACILLSTSNGSRHKLLLLQYQNDALECVHTLQMEHEVSASFSHPSMTTSDGGVVCVLGTFQPSICMAQVRSNVLVEVAHITLDDAHADIPSSIQIVDKTLVIGQRNGYMWSFPLDEPYSTPHVMCMGERPLQLVALNEGHVLCLAERPWVISVVSNVVSMACVLHPHVQPITNACCLQDTPDAFNLLFLHKGMLHFASMAKKQSTTVRILRTLKASSLSKNDVCRMRHRCSLTSLQCALWWPHRPSCIWWSQ